MRHARCASVEYAGFAFCGFQSQPSRCGVQDALEERDRRDRRASGRRGRRRSHRCRRARRVADRSLRHRGRASADGVGARGEHALAGATAAVLWAHPVARRVPCAVRRDGAPLHVSPPESRASAPASWRDAWAGTITRSMSTRCAPRAAHFARHARFLVVSCGGVPGEVAGQDAYACRSRRTTARSCASIFPPTPSSITWCATSSVRLIAVGAGRQPPAWIGELLAARDRTRGAPTFAPDGLYFAGADYDARFGLPPTRAARSAP